MKKLLLLFTATLLVNFFVSAQIEKGTKMLGGDLAFSKGNYNANSNGSTSSNYTFVSISPSYSWATKKNVLTGVNIMFGYSSQPTSQNGPNGVYYSKFKALNTGAGIFKRKYIGLGKGFYVFGDASFNIAYSRSKNSGTDLLNSSATATANNYAAGINIYPGISYQVNKRFMIDLAMNSLAGISFTHSETKYEAGNVAPYSVNGNAFNLSSGLNAGSLGDLSIGFKLMLK